MSVERSLHGRLKGGREIGLFRITNRNGMSAAVSEFGAILTSLAVPGLRGRIDDIALGYDSLDGYVKDPSQFNVIIGRCAGRIAGAFFELDGEGFELEKNEGENHLHGGDIAGFHKQVWTGRILPEDAGGNYTSGEEAVEFSYISPDGQGGYPGRLDVRVTYTLTDTNELKVDFRAQTDRATPVSLTHHSYFNLRGAGNGAITEHELTVYSSRVLENGEGYLMTGRSLPVAGTGHDFRTSKIVGRDIENPTPQRIPVTGYVPYFIIDPELAPGDDGGVRKAAVIREPESGRIMTLKTTNPGMLFYTAEHLDGSLVGRGGRVYQKRGAFCLEPMGYPDAVNQSCFPTTVIRPGEEYRQTTIYAFSTLQDA